MPLALSRLVEMEKEAREELKRQGFNGVKGKGKEEKEGQGEGQGQGGEVVVARYLNIRYSGTDTSTMTSIDHLISSLPCTTITTEV